MPALVASSFELFTREIKNGVSLHFAAPHLCSGKRKVVNKKKHKVRGLNLSFELFGWCQEEISLKKENKRISADHENFVDIGIWNLLIWNLLEKENNLLLIEKITMMGCFLCGRKTVLLVLFFFLNQTMGSDEAGRQWEYPPNDALAEDTESESAQFNDKRGYGPLLHSLPGKRLSEGTLLRDGMLSSRLGTWKRPAHGQLPLLHQLLGYTGKRDGATWKLPFGKRSLENWAEDETEEFGEDVKRSYDDGAPLLHQGFMSGKRAYGPLLHTMSGKRSWNDLPVPWSQTKKYDYRYTPLLHQSGVGKRAYIPILHTLAGKRERGEQRLKREKELMEHTIDENMHVVPEWDKKAPGWAASLPYYESSFHDIETRGGRRSSEERRKWMEFSRRYPMTLGRKRRSVPESPGLKDELDEKRGWGSNVINPEEIRNRYRAGKRSENQDGEDQDKRAVPLLHQMQMSGKRSEGLNWNMFGKIRSKKDWTMFDKIRSKKDWTMFDKIRSKKNWDMFDKIRSKKHGDMYHRIRTLKRNSPLLHQLEGFGKRLDDNDVGMGSKRATPLLHQTGAFGKRFSDNAQLGDAWRDLDNEKRNMGPIKFGKRETHGSETGVGETPSEADDAITKKSSAPILHQMGTFGKRSDVTDQELMSGDVKVTGIKKAAPLLHQIGGFGKKSQGD